MKQFRSFINTRKGQLLWLIAVLFIIFSPPYSANITAYSGYDLVKWFISALMVFYAVVYLEDLKTRNLKLWKVFAILLPLPTYVYFLILRYLKIGSGMRRLKAFLLIGSPLFFIVAFVIFYNVVTYTDMVNSYADSFNKALNIEKEVNKIFNELDFQQPDKKLYQNSLLALEKQQTITSELITSIDNVQQTIVASVFTEIKNKTNAAKKHYTQMLKNIDTNIAWNQEVLKENSDKSKISQLLEKSNNEQKESEKTLAELEKIKVPPTFLKIIASHLWSLSIALFLVVLSLALLIINFIVIVRTIQKKMIVFTVGWFLLGIINSISLFLLMLTALSF